MVIIDILIPTVTIITIIMIMVIPIEVTIVIAILTTGMTTLIGQDRDPIIGDEIRAKGKSRGLSIV